MDPRDSSTAETNEEYKAVVRIVRSLKGSGIHVGPYRPQYIPDQIKFLQQVGITLDDIDKLNPIHVTGTKGKGSTCTFTESILRQYGYKTGLFTSPHFLEIRERIRINGRPISKARFCKHFWDVYKKFCLAEIPEEGKNQFTFVMAMAFRVFMEEKIDVAVMEVGIGGEYSATNVMRQPVACGIALIHLDHTNLLGSTVEQIAWHKAGILREGAIGVSVPQCEGAMNVILERAKQTKCPIYIADPLNTEDLAIHKLKLSIPGDQQKCNAALSVQLCRAWLSSKGKHSNCVGSFGDPDQSTIDSIADIPHLQSSSLTIQMIRGLSECSLPGRCQTVRKDRVTYYLDVAHTTDSIEHCVRWFQDASSSEEARIGGKVYRALVFYISGQRPTHKMLKSMKSCGFHLAAFCPNIACSANDDNLPDMSNPNFDRDVEKAKCADNKEMWDRFLAQCENCTTNICESCISKSGDSVLVMNGESSTPNSVALNSYNNVHGDYLLPGEETHRVIPTSEAALPPCASATFPCLAAALRWVTHGRAELPSPQETGEYVDLCPVPPPEVEGVKDAQLIQVLVVGSFPLVGGAMFLVCPNMND